VLGRERDGRSTGDVGPMRRGDPRTGEMTIERGRKRRRTESATESEMSEHWNSDVAMISTLMSI